jgi:hypothetical protein
VLCCGCPAKQRLEDNKQYSCSLFALCEIDRTLWRRNLDSSINRVVLSRNSGVTLERISWTGIPVETCRKLYRFLGGSWGVVASWRPPRHSLTF